MKKIFIIISVFSVLVLLYLMSNIEINGLSKKDNNKKVIVDSFNINYRSSNKKQNILQAVSMNDIITLKKQKHSKSYIIIYSIYCKYCKEMIKNKKDFLNHDNVIMINSDFYYSADEVRDLLYKNKITNINYITNFSDTAKDYQTINKSIRKIIQTDCDLEIGVPTVFELDSNNNITKSYLGLK